MRYWNLLILKHRNSHRRCSVKIDVLKNFVKFIGKHLCQSLYFNEVTGDLAQVFSCKFCEIFKNSFFTEHRWPTASVSTYLARKKNFVNLSKSAVFCVHFHIYLKKLTEMMFYVSRPILLFQQAIFLDYIFETSNVWVIVPG